MIRTHIAFILLFVSFAGLLRAAPGEPTTYKVTQTTKLEHLPEGTKSVRWWIAIPDDAPAQQVLDFAVISAPGEWSVHREPDRGNRLLYVEIETADATTLETVVEFTLCRQPVLRRLDSRRVGKLRPDQRDLFAEELRRDAPHMQVTPELQTMADEVCGDDDNAATQARALLEHVMSLVDHYSKDPTRPSCGIGDAGACVLQGGGCCTDLHSLFIALARARGIPARLQMGYRLLEKNVGREVDPGYRCWPEYFVPGYGWVPADVVEADNATDPDVRDLWLTGLTERRLWLNSGREFQLTPTQAGGPVNHMSIAYAEIDGVPARVLPEGDLPAQITRTIVFEELEDEESAALTAK